MIASPIDLIAKLKHYLSTHHNIEKDSRYAGNKHIFEVCIEKLEDRLSIDEKMILMDLHLCYTNSLAAARENDLGTSNFWLNNAKQIAPFERPILQMLVDLNYLPAFAFYLYKNQQFDEAIDLLQKTVTISGLFQQESGIDYIVWGQMEEYINIFRVHCTNKNTKQALLYASAILKAVACLELSPNIIENVSIEVLKKAEINFINYATNDIITRLLLSTELPLKALLEKVFFPLIYTENAKECPYEGYIETLKVLKAIADANFNQAKDLLQFGSLQFHKQAHLLQFTLIEFLIPFLKNQDDTEMKNTLAQQINDYYLQELMIQPTILQKYSTLDYTPSIT